MRSLGRISQRPQPVMNVTPLVDVVLVLLIIFMVVVPMMDKSGHIELPGIFNADEDPKGKTDPHTLSLTTDGRMFLETEELDPVTFKTRLNAALEREPARRLILRADRNASYAAVRKVFGVCQEVGFPGISLRVNEIKKAKK
jgi:biopolymer transport protein TolR